VRKSNATRGGNRAGAGAKKDLERAALAIQAMPTNAAAQIVQGLLIGDRENALSLIKNLILVEHQAEAERLAEECARLMMPYHDLWGVEVPVEKEVALPPPRTLTDRKDDTSRAAALLREIAGFANRRQASAVVNHVYAGQNLTPRGEKSMKDESQHAEVARIRQAAQDERTYWRLVFELNAKLRADELTPDDLEKLQAIAPSDLAPD
jgi:hypothetical protein